MTNYKLFHVLAGGWMGLIFILSSQSSLPAPDLLWQQDKLLHLVVFGILGILLAYSLKEPLIYSVIPAQEPAPAKAGGRRPASRNPGNHNYSLDSRLRVNDETGINQGLLESPGISTWWRVILLTVLVTVYGASDEYHQSFVAGRDASLWDLLADGVGGFLAAVMLFWRKRRTVKISQYILPSEGGRAPVGYLLPLREKGGDEG